VNVAKRFFELRQTCSSCPEAYNVFHEDHGFVGYLQLRSRFFTATLGCDSYTSRIVYSAETRGDGRFEPEERDYHLNEGCKALKEAMQEQAVRPEDLIFEFGPSQE
jgi:hypothetical protein